MERIRYDKTDEKNIVVSKRLFISSINGAQYKVYLNIEDKTFTIRNIGSCRIVKTGGDNINNLNVLKRRAKSELKKLGVSFEEETRDRTFGRCQKGYTQEIHKGNK
tara:strand:- start:1504 stop:1821 length:318 start_codon:yes stop_codon:yes gene_type:complete